METREECAGGFKKVRETGQEKRNSGETNREREKVQLGRSGLGFKMGEKGKREKGAIAIGSFGRTRMQREM